MMSTTALNEIYHFKHLISSAVETALDNASIVISGGAIQSISSSTQDSITTAMEIALGQVMIPLMRMASPNFMGVVCSGSITSTTAIFNDTLAGYSNNQLVSGFAKILSSSTGVIYQASVAANSSQTVTLNSLAGNYTPKAGDSYAILYPL